MTTILRSAVILILLLSACAPSITVKIDYDHTADFSAYKTYAWAVPSEGSIKGLVDSRIESAIDSEMAAKGFISVATQRDADLVVAYSTNQKTKTAIYSDGWGWGWGGMDVSQYDEGTLLVAIADMKTRGMVWQGTAQKIVDSSSGSQEVVDKAIAQMFASFPPGN